jgi:hypothetical protein
LPALGEDVHTQGTVFAFLPDFRRIDDGTKEQHFPQARPELLVEQVKKCLQDGIVNL